MPLSEQEQRLLDEMERSLYHGDADFVASVGRVRGRVSYAAVVGGILLAVAGMGVLVLGVVRAQLADRRARLRDDVRRRRCIAVGVRNRRLPAGFPAAPGARPTGFMDRLAQRWERRRQS